MSATRRVVIGASVLDHYVEDVPPADWLTVCASCCRGDLPLTVQASGAYALCVRCETIARAELAEWDR